MAAAGLFYVFSGGVALKTRLLIWWRGTTRRVVEW